ncbi:major facilitator superfamily transporter [Rhizodiscina lignyota]|uniref:Major facilitator superfamily transporter n=1 Tax=Rhizodiscina lignyota TaxID=1504668 RepID=A0A9P4M3X1_9PEZI|nr:major facilitator superfamily transporter [Rhizodiscina lignyota]
MGTSTLYENGQIRYIPMPTPDPKDPLNLKTWRKRAALIAICFFGALALSAEVLIGGLIPVFALEYSGIDPKILNDLDISTLNPPGVVNLDPLSFLDDLGGPPLWKVSLLASLPLLTNGISSYFLVPLSISIGRRPVLLFCGILAWTGGFWAGCSKSLESHIVARCVQAIGAGAVEALIPLIVQDLVFIHQRNNAMSAIWATQGLIMIGLGSATPVIAANLGWRYLYYISASIAVVAWFALIAFVPETRWMRSKEELNGQPVSPLCSGRTRPCLNYTSYGERTLWTDLGLFQSGFEHRAAAKSMLDTLRTMFYPNVLWVVIINGVVLSIDMAAGQVLSPVLIASGWNFKTLGFAVAPFVLAAPCVWVLGGVLADKASNAIARQNGGRREPEAHLANIVFPLLCTIVGCILFGNFGDHTKQKGIPSLVGMFLIVLGSMTANTVMNVYIVESYPQWAGPVLVNVSSFRCIIGFAMSFRAITWIQQRGFLSSFSIYAGVLGFALLFLPLMYWKGKAIRQWTSGTVKSATEVERELGNYIVNKH